ncbi:MAG: hypothetical protein A3I49_02110 [Candidatus Levybacteria bacterium RIFCSPLOWO2_02_FULL_37_11]|nr:MAG: hypothetical protein A3I49_02110 [Candidatus Levybacteria bacterium RIFCSPLOWO2_02_FULL_37_11]
MTTEAEKLLNKGLAGYTGDKTSRVERGSPPFVGKSSDFRDGLDGYYRDEWFAHRTGGGQELAIVEGKTVTRVYGGGVVDEEYLREAGITEEEVSAKHKEFLSRAKGKTRLHDEYFDEFTEGDKRWAYEYRVLHYIKQIPQTIGIEMMHVNSHIVFSHGFVNTTVE